MSQWSRRDLLKRAGAASAAAAGAAVALNPGGALAAASSRGRRSADEPALDAAEAAAVTADGPLMVCVRDAHGGAVSILHGTEEVVVNDRRLVAKIVRAKKSGAAKA
jgi:hypothetical protein